MTYVDVDRVLLLELRLLNALSRGNISARLFFRSVFI